MQSTLLIFAKPPRMGLAKTRLATAIGATHAQRINRYCHTKTMQAALSPRWKSYLCIAPDKDILSPTGNLWPANFVRQAQGQGDLGQRLSLAFRSAPKGPVIVIGTDAPDICKSDIHFAFNSLKKHDAVFGPADDGGFWLFGASTQLRRQALHFNPVRWSSQYALEDMRQTLPNGTQTKLLHSLIDIDDLDSLKKWSANSKQ